MTEGGWFSSFPFPEVDTSGSVGRMMPGYSVKFDRTHVITDAFGIEQEVGEILVQAPQLAHAYVGNIEATNKAFDEDGFLRTGDIGYKDSLGRIFIVDRAKDLIKVNGWQVSPSELQNVLLGCPLVRDAAVVGAGSPGEEFAAAFVVPHTGDDSLVTADLVKSYLKGQCASYKTAGCSVTLVQELPLGNTGKVDVKALKMLL
jgi:acyl-CoA synthetase (AMP-forming)/AMP-acid ligase II